MRLGIVGGGVVGSATARCFIEHVDDVLVYDSNPLRCTATLAETMDADLIFVCLSTPQKEGSLECDTGYADAFLCACSEFYRSKNLVLKSTVPIGYTRKAQEKWKLTNLVHSPEFLTARCAFTDAQIPARNIIGNPSAGNQAAVMLNILYHTRFPGVTCLLMTSDESEAVKLMQNSFFAVKVAFWNEMYQLVAKMGLDWDLVQQAILADGRIAHSHTKVPGPDGKFGFGGACLEKDLANLLNSMYTNELTASVCTGAHERNLEDRKR